MHKLQIHHAGGLGSTKFELRLDSGSASSAPAVELTDPLNVSLGGSDLTLSHELAWYLEDYVDFPAGPHAVRAKRLLAALNQWGRQSFESLFGHGQAREFYRDATREGHDCLKLVVASDDPRVLSWPWEALSDPQVGDLAHLCRIERRLNSVPDPLPLPEHLSRDRVRMLLVTARPLRNDVAYRSVTRPLVELVRQERLPVEVKLLRPPTFAQLQRELCENADRYHIVHFDGHGGFGLAPSNGKDDIGSPQGHLLFEDADGADDAVSAEQFGELLREHRIPVVVLNACQSAMLNEDAEDVFASVATALLRAGVGSVVAMSYSLYVEGARQFLPAFYGELFRTGDVARATFGGRQAMLKQPERVGVPLKDWLVPVLYQQASMELVFAAQAPQQPDVSMEAIPLQARLDVGHAPHGAIGRDSSVLAMERASRRAPAAMLLHGLGGVGKTTLARGYIDWLAHTAGLPELVVWQNLADVRSFDYVRNRLVEKMLGADAMAAPDVEKWPKLVLALRERTVLIVWDNFEGASGAADANAHDGSLAGLEAMSTGARQDLKEFLKQLRGGRSKVLIISRSDEQWLDATGCFSVPLGGLRGEERRRLARAIMADHGVQLDHRDRGCADLIDSLHGHPLMMRAILPKLAHETADQLRSDLDRYLPKGGSGDAVEEALHATLQYVEHRLPEHLRTLLMPMGLHERFVHPAMLEVMAEKAECQLHGSQIRNALDLLEGAGLLRSVGGNGYEMHPAFERYARMRGRTPETVVAALAAWERAFCGYMARVAQLCVNSPLANQRTVFEKVGGSFGRALEIAKAIGDTQSAGALLQTMAAYAVNKRNLPLAEQLFEAEAGVCEQAGLEANAASAYCQRGKVAMQRRDFKAAEAWYHKALAIAERLGEEDGMAVCYGQLGTLAKERGDLAGAGSFQQKMVALEESSGDSESAEKYAAFAEAALRSGVLPDAMDYYLKAATLEEDSGKLDGAAASFFQIGQLAEQQRDFDAAGDWYARALEIFEKLGNEFSAAATSHQLGRVAQEKRDFGEAEAWYRRALQTFEALDSQYEMATAYYQLSMVSYRRADLDIAEAWCRKAATVFELAGDPQRLHIARGFLDHLGSLLRQRGATGEDRPI